MTYREKAHEIEAQEEINVFDKAVDANPEGRAEIRHSPSVSCPSKALGGSFFTFQEPVHWTDRFEVSTT